MDVSPRALRAVTFREKLRGYHPDDVDQFLERVSEGVAALQAKLDDALSRAEKAETERDEVSEGEEAVRRTLTLAERTADLALKEAKDEAARIIADANDAATRLADEAQQQLRSDIERLETARKQLHDDVLAMQQYVEHERTRVRNVLADLVRKVDGTAKRPPAPPAPTPVDIPAPRAERIIVERPAPAPARPPIPAPQPGPPPPDPVAAPEPVVAAVPEEIIDSDPTGEIDLGVPEPAVPEPGLPEAPTRIRREPQPPPVSGVRFAQAFPASGKPSGPPPGPRRLAAASDEEGDDDSGGEEELGPNLRRLLGR